MVNRDRARAGGRDSIETHLLPHVIHGAWVTQSSHHHGRRVVEPGPKTDRAMGKIRVSVEAREIT